MKTGRNIKNLKERNKWFNSLSAPEKRVEIAKDLIHSLVYIFLQKEIMNLKKDKIFKNT